MKSKTTMVLLGISLLGLSGVSHADQESVKNAVEHPIDTHHQEASDASTDSAIISQRRSEARATLDQAKTNYEKSLEENGAASQITMEAKKRYHSAQKEYDQLTRKATKLDGEIRNQSQKK